MGLNLNDWLGAHMWVLWLMLALMLGSLELIRRDRLYAVLAGASAVTALVALVFPRWWAQLPIVVVLSLLGLLVIRPRLRQPGGSPAADPS